MQSDASATIFAVASGAGRAAITVVRVSGPACETVLRSLCRVPTPRRASLRVLRDQSGHMLDQALVLWFPGPDSYTGEDSAELHLHGGTAVIAGVAQALTQAGARPAEPGEFTRRAFRNGRMDLLQAEAVIDLIEAETEAQRSQALRQMSGALGDIYRDWARRLLGLLAHQEALIDFPDEDLPTEIDTRMAGDIAALRDTMQAHLEAGRRGERLRDGIVIGVAGVPNAGKSTLINALAARDVAIVSPIPGTTRDVIEARVHIAGVPVTLLDTAGLRDTADPIEAEGVRRARARLAEADLVLSLTETGEPSSVTHPTVLGVATKVDLGRTPPTSHIAVSALTGQGMATLRDALEAAVKRLAGTTERPVLTRARHRSAVAEAVRYLDQALSAAMPELRGEELRLAVRALGRLTGETQVDDVLDLVFGEFCIGK